MSLSTTREPSFGRAFFFSKALATASETVPVISIGASCGNGTFKRKAWFHAKRIADSRPKRHLSDGPSFGPSILHRPWFLKPNCLSRHPCVGPSWSAVASGSRWSLGVFNWAIWLVFAAVLPAQDETSVGVIEDAAEGKADEGVRRHVRRPAPELAAKG